MNLITLNKRLFSVFLGGLVLLALSCCREGARDGFHAEVIGGSSLITDILEDLSDMRVEAYTLLPSASCPSQFDMKPRDIQKLQQAQVVVLHPWQLQLANIRRTLEAAGTPPDRQRLIEVPGNWMIPEIQVQAVLEIKKVLSSYAPDSEPLFHERAEARIARIEAECAAARAVLPGEEAAAAAVLCHEMQAPFLQWAGFEVAGTFNRPEDWSVAETEALVRTGRASGVRLVVDNLQSGGLAMSATLANDIGAVHAVLSNFPGGFPDTPTWQDAFQRNIRHLREALDKAALP